MFLPELLVNSCLVSSKKDSTEGFAGDGQECDSSPFVTDLEVAFLRDLYNESFAPVTWDSLFVQNGVEQVSQDTCSCTEVGLQHFSMDGVYAWGFSTRFPLFIALMAFLTSASVGRLVSMLRSSVSGGGRRDHLAEGGSGLHRNM